VDRVVARAEKSALVDDVAHCFGEKGRLNRAIDGFQSRPQQTGLAEEIAEAIEKKSILIAEAGTGTGKTFAYLIPCLLSGKKAIISTATKTLQDQLFHKDLPLLVRALGLSVRIQNLKGRANYICRYRVALNTESGRFRTSHLAPDFIYVLEALPRLKEGDRSELPKLQDDAEVWPHVTSTTDNCLGNECDYFKDCFLVKARKRAQEADVVVINHHLFFADTRLKEGGFGELLPGVDTLVFDEAHQLADIAMDFFGERFSTKQWQDWINDAHREWPVVDQVQNPMAALCVQFDRCVAELLPILPFGKERFSWRLVSCQPKFLDVMQSFSELSKKILICFSGVDIKENAVLGRLHDRLLELKNVLGLFLEPKSDKIRWIECFKHHVTFHATPYEVATTFRALLNDRQAYIFTSATLTVADAFSTFLSSLGLSTNKTLLLPSPFDYSKQALLYLPRTLPDTKHVDYHKALLDRARPLIEALKGRCFFLFTSHKALKEVAALLEGNCSYPLLVQGEESKSILLARFRELGNAVLLVTCYFLF